MAKVGRSLVYVLAVLLVHAGWLIAVSRYGWVPIYPACNRHGDFYFLVGSPDPDYAESFYQTLGFYFGPDGVTRRRDGSILVRPVIAWLEGDQFEKYSWQALPRGHAAAAIRPGDPGYASSCELLTLIAFVHHGQVQRRRIHYDIGDLYEALTGDTSHDVIRYFFRSGSRLELRPPDIGANSGFRTG